MNCKMIAMKKVWEILHWASDSFYFFSFSFGSEVETRSRKRKVGRTGLMNHSFNPNVRRPFSYCYLLGLNCWAARAAWKGAWFPTVTTRRLLILQPARVSTVAYRRWESVEPAELAPTQFRRLSHTKWSKPKKILPLTTTTTIPPIHQPAPNVAGGLLESKQKKNTHKKEKRRVIDIHHWITIQFSKQWRRESTIGGKSM